MIKILTKKFTKTDIIDKKFYSIFFFFFFLGFKQSVYTKN